VHRLDAPTGGLLVVAKTQEALTKLCVAFAERCALSRSLPCLFSQPWQQSAAVAERCLGPPRLVFSRQQVRIPKLVRCL